ncbi:hypothetical protein MKW94_010296 [Papaver nudicaule]|uniref:DUF8039 domain-containing protein n=1 Tax=Papaver nudicaule TaxID=74823 RepID=A0AA41S9F1_PAPNU|nr:hypothetical protein [Papaver nudicaule]
MENDNDVPREEETEVVEEPKEKRKYGPRGPTQMQALGLGPGKGMKPTDKRTVCFNSKNQPVGDPSVQLASVLGVLVRRNLPLTKVDWRHVPEGTKDNIWTQRFIVDDFYKDYYVSKMGTYLKEARSRKAGVILKAFKDLEGEAREKRLAEIQPTSMTVKRLEMQNVRQKHNTPHTISRKGYARLEEEMQKELDTTEEIPPVELWKTGHKQREGRDPNPGVVEAFDKIKKAQAEQGGESGSTVTDDILAIALGDKDKPGRLRGIGFGPTRKKLETQSHYKKLLKDCQDKFEAMNDRLVTLESGNASNNRASTSRTVCANGTASPPIGFGPDSTTPTSSPNGVQKPFKGQECKLLSWYNEGEVVDDATIFETDPEKVVHGFLLGFGAYSVCVLCAHVQKAHLFRPTSEFQFVDEAEGSFVAWPKDKILF